MTKCLGSLLTKLSLLTGESLWRMLSRCQMTAINNNKTRTPSVIKQLLASSEALEELEVDDEFVIFGSNGECWIQGSSVENPTEEDTYISNRIATTFSVWNTATMAAFMLGSKPPIWLSFLLIGPWIKKGAGILGVCSGPPIWRLGRYTFCFLHCCKSEPSMCRQLREMGGGVDDLHCCATHSRGVLKPGNSWSQQSVHHFIHGRQDEQLDSRWDPGDASGSSVSVAVFFVHLLL